jgi:tetratricopeptide (TPR) repeat protein
MSQNWSTLESLNSQEIVEIEDSKNMRPLLLFFFLIGETPVLAQKKTALQLKEQLEITNQDTARCRILAEIVEKEGNAKIWPIYNQQLLSLAKKNSAEIKTKKDRLFYLKYLAIAINNVGYLADENGQISVAIHHYQEALKIYSQVNDKQGMATAYNNIGYIYDNQGDIPMALIYYYKSLKLREKIGDIAGTATSLNNIGYVYSLQGETQKAIDNHQKALQLNKLIKNKRGIANAMTLLGSNYSKMGDFPKALTAYKGALVYAQEGNYSSIVGASLNNIGSIHDRQHQYSLALNYFQQALSIYGEFNSKKGMAKTLVNIATSLLAQKKVPDALTNAKRSMQIAQELGYPEDIKAAAYVLKKIYTELKNFQFAYQMFQLEIVMRDSINNLETKQASIKGRYKYEYETKAAADSIKNSVSNKIKTAQLSAQKAELKNEKTKRYSLYAGLLFLLFLAGFVWNRFQLTRRQKALIEKQKLLVEEHQNEIVDSINYAKRLQDAILAPLDFIQGHTRESFVFYQPKDIVAGDFYWSEKIGNYFFIAAADCTGHGVPGAMVSMVCCNALTRSVNEFGITEPGEILDNVKVLVEEMFKNGDEIINDGMDISFCRIDLSKKEIKWSGANNSLYYVQNKELKNIKADKQHIGKTDQSKAFTTHLLDANELTTLYLFTDGYIDQFGGPAGKKFKIRQFTELIGKIMDKPLVEQAAIFEKEFSSWKGELEQIDDVCVIGIQV